jgi:hypothetical protein
LKIAKPRQWFVTCRERHPVGRAGAHLDGVRVVAVDEDVDRRAGAALR